MGAETWANKNWLVLNNAKSCLRYRMAPQNCLLKPRQSFLGISKWTFRWNCGSNKQRKTVPNLGLYFRSHHHHSPTTTTTTFFYHQAQANSSMQIIIRVCFWKLVTPRVCWLAVFWIRFSSVCLFSFPTAKDFRTWEENKKNIESHWTYCSIHLDSLPNKYCGLIIWYEWVSWASLVGSGKQ